MILDLIDKDALNDQPKEQWLNLFKSHAIDRGYLVSYKNTGFHTETLNGLSITRLDYQVTYSKGELKERIDFVKRGSRYKIISYEILQCNKEIVSNQ
jgi:hypothetical protein